MPDGALGLLTVAALAAVQLGLALVLGAVASWMWLRGSTSAWQLQPLTQATVMCRTGLLLGLAGIAFSLGFAAAAMDDPGGVSTWVTAVDLLVHTHFGHAWLVSLCAWLTCAVLLMRGWRGLDLARLMLAVLPLLGVFVLSRSAVSHAASSGDVTLDVLVDAVHLALTSLWVGIVVAGAALRLPADAASLPEREPASRWVSRMSSTATASLAGVFVTGAFKVWRSMAVAGSMESYAFSPYGHALGAKLLLVGLAAVLGGFNRFLVLPRLLTAMGKETLPGALPGRRSLVLVLRVELLTLLGALVLAAVLSSTEPPN